MVARTGSEGVVSLQVQSAGPVAGAARGPTLSVEQHVTRGTVELRLLGPAEARRDGRPLRLRTKKAFALLAYLAAQGRTHRRAELAALLWPDSEDQFRGAAEHQSLEVAAVEVGQPGLEHQIVRLVRGREAAHHRVRLVALQIADSQRAASDAQQPHPLPGDAQPPPQIVVLLRGLGD